MKIAVITPLLSIAGVPLAQVRFARSLAEKGYKVDLIIGHIVKGHKLPKIIQINKTIITNNNRVIYMLIPIIKYIIKEKPDIIFSAEDHLNLIVIIAAIITFSKVKISGSSRVTPFDTYSRKIFSKRWLLKQLMKLFMWRANALTCVSKDMVNQYKKIFKKSNHKYAYNIILDNNSKIKMNEAIDHKWFKSKNTPVLIAAGRLAEWKGFEYLINAFKLIEFKTNANLIILGDGELKEYLQNLIDNLNLSNRIELLGYVDNTYKYFKHSDIFILSSLVEGLPNVLVEAMMCGCTPVSTNCPTGPREVLQDGRFGYLVKSKDSKDLAEGIIKALNKPIKKEVLNLAIQPFKDTTVINRHFNLLNIE